MKDAGLRYKNKNEFVSDRRKNMLKNIIKVLAGISVLSLMIVCSSTFVEASTENKNTTVNDKTEMTAKEYFDTWETISEDELPKGIIPLKFDSEEEAYSYLKENDEEWLYSEDEIFIVGSEEVSEEIFNEYLKEDFYNVNDTVPFDKKNKVVSTRRIGGKGIVKLIVNYDVEKENGKNAIVSANAGVAEQNIPDNYNVYVDNTECVISRNKKSAQAKATGMIERSIVIKNRLRIQRKKLNMSGSVRI